MTEINTTDMHINHCSKCGQAFETKNPKRIVCPNCLYLDRAAAPSVAPVRQDMPPQQGGYPPRGYNAGPGYQQPHQQQQPYRQGPPYPPRQGGYDNRPPQQHQSGGYRPPYPQQQGGPRPYNPQYGGPPRPAGPGGPGVPGGYGQPQQGNFQPQRPRGFGPPRPGGFPRGGPPQRGPGGPRRGPGGPPKKLLVPREALIEIEKRYKEMLPLPNPDAHVVIGEALKLEPNKVFFGINLVRQKMRLPKLDYPKRPLAVTEDQLMAVKALYEPFLPMPPIGIHKIISKQLRMDEWRVHVAIGLIRKQMAMPRWNEQREDLPPHMKEQLAAAAAAVQQDVDQQQAQADAAPAKKPRPRKKADAEPVAPSTPVDA